MIEQVVAEQNKITDRDIMFENQVNMKVKELIHLQNFKICQSRYAKAAKQTARLCSECASHVAPQKVDFYLKQQIVASELKDPI